MHQRCTHPLSRTPRPRSDPCRFIDGGGLVYIMNLALHHVLRSYPVLVLYISPFPSCYCLSLLSLTHSTTPHLRNSLTHPRNIYRPFPFPFPIYNIQPTDTSLPTSPPTSTMPSYTHSSPSQAQQAQPNSAADAGYYYVNPVSSMPSASVRCLGCLRCARFIEITSTDDLASAGMVLIGEGLFYCTTCAHAVGFPTPISASQPKRISTG